MWVKGVRAGVPASVPECRDVGIVCCRQPGGRTSTLQFSQAIARACRLPIILTALLAQNGQSANSVIRCRAN
jgi:hypothetical protein